MNTLSATSLNRREFLAAMVGGWVTAESLQAEDPRPVRIVIPKTRQLLLAIADDWNRSAAKLQAFEAGQKGWRPVFSESVPVLLGRNGLAWGRGAVPPPPGGKAKREGDGRAPAGFFRIGKVFGDAAKPPEGTALPYNQVTRWDAWSDDPKNPYYNRHIRIDPKKGVPDWFEKARMRLGDPAYRWLIEIRHNADPKPVPGAGSAIFFHIRRGATRPTAGCTSMRESDLVKIMRWLRPTANPHYVLLPRAECERLKAVWQLPEFE